MLFSISHLSFAYGADVIFDDVSFAVKEKAHIGLIGPNGCGKTTFFKLINRELLPDSGDIHLDNHARIGTLKQDLVFDEDQTLYQFLLAHFSHLTEMEQQMAQLQETIDSSSGDTQTQAVMRLSELQERFAAAGGYEYPSRIRGVTAGLGFSTEDMDRPIRSFSGGQKTRIALDALLLSEPDLLLLDEPTNYLDLDALAWLETYLTNYAKAFVVISHDRYFLDRVAQSITLVENHRLVSFNGNYSSFLEQKEKRDAAQRAAAAKNNAEIARQEKIIGDLRARHSVKAIKRAKSRENKLKNMAVMEAAHHDAAISLRFEPRVRSADDVLKVAHLSKRFDDQPVLSDISFEVFREDRIGIIGPNGTGKTTLLRIINRQLPLDSGRLSFGPKVQTGYYSQEAADSAAYHADDLIDALRQIDGNLSDGEARNILARFLFTGEAVFKPVTALSGGEMARLRLAQLMISDANFLLLDEPTNHIDMPTKEILEDALADYGGTVLAVSHDRYFLNKVATKILVLNHDGIELFEGNYDDYLETLAQRAQDAQAQQKLSPSTTKTAQKKSIKAEHIKQQDLRRQKNQLRQLEKTIESLDQQIAELEKAMCAPDFYDDPEQAESTTREYGRLKQESETKMREWEKLATALENQASS